jgi:hemerythrin-like metal-binding protein
LLQCSFDCLRNTSDEETQHQVLGELIRCTMAHFAAEEAAMESFGYPGLRQHQQEHQDLTSEVLDYTATSGRELTEAAIGLESYAHHFLTWHILQSDRRLADFLRAGQSA